MRDSLFAVIAALMISATHAADDPVFSGPQVGEKTVSFRVAGVYGEDAGREIDFIKRARGKPLVLIFNHKLTRPGAAPIRSVSSYCLSRKKDGPGVFVVWLAKDKSAAEEYLTRARLSVGIKAPIGISLEGQEGPGAYGLNRNVELTILIANKNIVTANFALVQPSVTDAPKIAKEIVRIIGGNPPALEEMNKLAYPNGGRNMKKRAMKKPQGKPIDPALGGLLRAVIQKDATEEQVQKAVKAVEDFVGDNREHQAQVARIAGVIVDRKYGTEAARKHAAAWQKKYAVPPKKETKSRKKDDRSENQK